MAEKPTIGQQNWGGQLNAYLEELETRIGEGGGGGNTAALEDKLAHYQALPVGITVSVYANGTTWPARPTSSTGVTVRWVGSDPLHPPTDALEGVDTWEYNSGGGGGHQVMAVYYDAGWPGRPTIDPTITVWWIGGDSGTPPTDALDGDVWDYDA